MAWRSSTISPDCRSTSLAANSAQAVRKPVCLSSDAYSLARRAECLGGTKQHVAVNDRKRCIAPGIGLIDKLNERLSYTMIHSNLITQLSSASYRPPLAIIEMFRSLAGHPFIPPADEYVVAFTSAESFAVSQNSSHQTGSLDSLELTQVQLPFAQAQLELEPKSTGKHISVQQGYSQTYRSRSHPL